MTNEEILNRLQDYDYFFTVDDVYKDFDGVSEDYNDDYLFLVRLFFDFEEDESLVWYQFKKDRCYMHPAVLEKQRRFQKIDQLLQEHQIEK